MGLPESWRGLDEVKAVSLSGKSASSHAPERMAWPASVLVILCLSLGLWFVIGGVAMLLLGGA
jgi:hypothetical protein